MTGKSSRFSSVQVVIQRWLEIPVGARLEALTAILFVVPLEVVGVFRELQKKLGTEDQSLPAGVYWACTSLVIFAFMGLVSEGLFFMSNALKKHQQLNSLVPFPVIARALFILVPKRSRRHLIGDLEEEYKTFIVPSLKPTEARRWWWGQVLGIVGPYVRKRIAQALGLELVRRWRRR